ncbi:hypothetical protein A8A54_22610 [Brucella pseudogrignonensis]|uniref:hypothetical protein n=1 Tax=Brucella pseudogrignonensis TaxID=419475 RepID=UPI0007DAA0FC|nr:hypothetical protein [Brucella pseudogrignonensis]ANG99327.1 hypothetical protein A8A54_22610 [Brucella pseudogrignonensis]
MKKIDPNKARQGPKGRPVLLVLLTSLILALLVWGAVEFYGQMHPGGGFMDDDATPPASTPSQTPPSASGRQ